MRWTKAEYDQYMQRTANAWAKRVNVNSAGGATSSPKPESLVCNASNGETQGTAHNTTRSVGRIKVSITSYRRKLLDPDNLCAKWFVDALRYAGAIPDDREQDIILEVAQRKVKTREEECTIIELT